MKLLVESLLSPVGDKLRNEVLSRYREVSNQYSLLHWEPAELNGGKFCEAVYSLLKAALDGDFSVTPEKPRNFKAACDNLERYPAAGGVTGDRSIRVLIPRVLIPLYEVRNNRGVGHIGGDVDPNFMDATLIMHQTSWTMAELVRIFHSVSISEAQEAVKQLTALRHPLVWVASNGQKRVLRTGLEAREQVIVLLYGETRPVSVKELQNWVNYKNPSNFKKIVTRLHNKRMLEFDIINQTAELSPRGVAEVEDKGLLNFVPTE